MPSSVSIIIPAWNAQRFIEQTLASVVRQRYPHWELVVVNDGSTDGTADIVRTYVERDKRIRLVTQQKLGRSVARNRGFAESDGTSAYCIFLDSDDVWEDDALELLAAALDRDSEAVGAHGPIRQIDANGDLIGHGQPLPASRLTIHDDGLTVVANDAPTTFNVLVRLCVIYTTGAMLVRRRALDTAGSFATALEGGEDWDLWIRISRIGHVAYVPRPVIRYRWYETSMTHADNQSLKAGYVAWKTLTSPDNTPGQRHAALLALLLLLSNDLSGDELDVVNRVISKRASIAKSARLMSRVLTAAKAGIRPGTGSHRVDQ
jgi:glycosyltransferase involved in cell wall biosynthesis